MKTKQVKDDQDKNLDEEIIEPKTRARKKATDTIDDDKSKPSQDEPRMSKEIKKVVNKPKAVVKRRPLGIRKTLRSKKAAIAKEKVKKVIQKTVTRGRKAAIKTEPDNSQTKEAVQLIPASEIKKEPFEDNNSRSSSPKTAGRRQRLSSDLAMMKTMLGDSSSSLVLGPRTSPYSMRSERSNSPSLFENKNLRSGKPRKVKNNLLNEVVMKEQKKRRRLLSDSKAPETAEIGEDCKKLKRGRSCSRDGSEISKCSDNTESDLSLSEPLNDTDSNKELNKNLDKSKTDLDVNIETNVQISNQDKVPFNNDKVSETKQDAETSNNLNKNSKRKLSLKRSPSLDSDNNNSNRLKLVSLSSLDIQNQLLMKPDDDPVLEDRSSILSCMSKTFNSKEMTKNLKKARRGRKGVALPRTIPNKIGISSTSNSTDDKQETESLSKEIDDLICNLDQNINRDHELASETTTENHTIDQMQVKQVSKFYGSPKPQIKDDPILSPIPGTPVVSNEISSDKSIENTDLKIDDSETIRLHYEEDPIEKSTDTTQHEITYKCSSVASIDKLMDRLKEFEEFDKRRHRLESESKVNDKSMMVTNDVVLIPKSGADIKPLKDIQAVRSPEKPIEKENVLSCFENNSAISIVKRDQVRKSVDIDLPNSVTLIKRNNFSSRKESVSSNHSRESDAISIFEKSLGKDVTLTEIRKTGDKLPAAQVDLHQFTSYPNNPAHNVVGGVVLDSNEISITPRILNEPKIISNEKLILPKQKSRESLSITSPEITNENKCLNVEKIKSPNHQNISPAISITSTPVAVKSAESTPMETEALPPPLENIKLEDISLASNVSKCGNIKDTVNTEITANEDHTKLKIPLSDETVAELLNTDEKSEENLLLENEDKDKKGTDLEVKMMLTKQSRSARSSTKSQPGSSNTSFVESKTSMDQLSKTIATVAPEDNIEDSTEKENIIFITDNHGQRRNSYSNTESKPKEYTLRNCTSESKTPLLNEMDNKPAKKTKSAKSIEALPEPNIPSDERKKRKEFVLRHLGMLGNNENKITNKDMGENSNNSTLNKSVNEVTNMDCEDTKESAVTILKESMIVINENEVKPSMPPKPAKADQPGPSNVFNETPETKKHKEYVLRTLGLLTHKAAKEAKIEKLKEKQRIYGANFNKNKTAKATSGDYTGTLKTVIKLNRGGDRDKKKQRSSLKMTFQKSKYRSGKPTPEIGDGVTEDDAYYTIERREGIASAASDGGHRKSHYSNRLNNHDAEAAPEPAEPKETLNLVIPEKASSFSIHPGRLCMDQCFYCGGKFGLFDTPCHIAQIKSSDRQKKILDNEEKLTIDSCLCDACYRHVDRRANCPSYRKRPPGKQLDVTGLPSLSTLPSPPSNGAEMDYKTAQYGQTNIAKTWSTDKPISPPLDEESEEDAPAPAPVSGRVATCHTEGCVGVAGYSIRRKWLIKMRSSVNKVLKLKCDYPGLHTIPLCAEHYRVLAPLMACALCRRRITKHHNVHFIHHGYLELNPLLCGAGVPVQFSERPVVCNACRNYCTLLQRLGHNHPSARAYRRKLLQIYNIEVPPESENEGEDIMTQEDVAAGKQKKKQRTKSKQRKSTEPEQNSESSEKTNESTPEKEKTDDGEPKEASIRDEEDIESLISSNKILVPGATKPNENMLHSDGSETENVCEFETPFLHVDKQTELQYLLQKQNNPAQFLQKPQNMSQKHRNIMKLQTVPLLQMPADIHRAMEKNAKKIHKIGQIFTQKRDKVRRDDAEDVAKEGVPILKNINLNDECTIESIPNKRPADINTLRNKWQMSESFTQVRKNLSELSKKFPGEKESKKANDAKYSNPVKRLETNPSISVRELFPGEEEMNLQCNVEFNNVKGITPEGWEKCNTLIQYDLETKKLWTELQRPYGNQSSFLRHLILLEKYFRSGDLVLSHNASPHAVNYSDSVQSRLRAYDNTVEPPRRNEQSISLIEFRKKPSMNGKSLLKSNQSDAEKDPKKFMPPPMVPKPKPKEKAKSKPLPPELIAINTPNAQGRKAIQNVLHNIQQLVKGVSASDPTEVAAAPLPPPKYEPPKEKKETAKTETPKKPKPTSKPWRPTLMPITPENLARIAREPTQVAVDGRNLPSLVQVMSSGNRYHITLQDYNKMCVMRREKLQQLRDGDKKRHSTDDSTVITEIQTSTMLGNGGTVVQNITAEEKCLDKRETDLVQMGNAATILKNVGLKNITIAPIPAKTATVTSHSLPPSMVTTPGLKIPQLGPSVSITSETVISPSVPSMPAQMMMPKIPKSLTVIPQTVGSVAQSAMVTTNSPSQAVISTMDGTRP